MSAIETMLLNIVKNSLANLPPEIKDNIDKIGATILAFKQQQDRIERNQQIIISALNLSPEILAQLEKPKGIENGQDDNVTG